MGKRYKEIDFGKVKTYKSIHNSVISMFGKANKCEACGNDKVPMGRKIWFEWSSKSRQSLKEFNDWWQLCMPCHRYYDSLDKIEKKKSLKEKKCTKCSQIKEIEMFSIINKITGYRYSACKNCRKKKFEKYLEMNRDKYKDYHKKYYQSRRTALSAIPTVKDRT